MLHKTRGIVLKSTDYSESSVIVQIFTEKFGLQSYLVNGGRKPKAKIRNNILQQLHLLELVVYHKPEGNLQRIAEARQIPVFQTIPYDIAKSSIVLFLNEVLYKTVKQESADEQLFDYIFHSIEFLDKVDYNLHLFHLHFLLKLTKNLGFNPELKNSGSKYFDLKEGRFVDVMPAHPFVLQAPYTLYFSRLIKLNFEELKNFKIPANERQVLLEKILEYYKLHIDGFGEIKSHIVLHEILN